MKGQPQTSYLLQVSTIKGETLYSCSGTLSKVIELAGEASPFMPSAPVSYHKVRREIIVNGAYYAAFKALPAAVFVLSIVSEFLIENEKKAVEVPLPFQEMDRAQKWEYVNTGKPQFGLKTNIHPKECTCTDCTPKHNHPTLSWAQMSPWQRKQYRVK